MFVVTSVNESPSDASEVASDRKTVATPVKLLPRRVARRSSCSRKPEKFVMSKTS
jgi:hypothetical protein